MNDQSYSTIVVRLPPPKPPTVLTRRQEATLRWFGINPRERMKA